MNGFTLILVAMKKMLSFFFLLLISAVGKAQKEFFIYLQSENWTPFYVKMGEKVQSSSSAGYIILPGLKDSTYSFYIGLPSQQASEARFTISTNGKDKGFLLKTMEGGLRLFDMQSSQVIQPKAMENAAETGVLRTDNFTKTLAQAADDPSLLIAIAKPEPVAAKEATAAKEPVKEGEIKQNNETLTETLAQVKREEKPKEDTITTTARTEGEVKTAAVEKEKAAEPKYEEEKQKMDTAAQASVEVKTEGAKEAITKEKEPVAEENKNRPEAVPPVTDKEYKRSVVIRRSESSTTEGFGLVFIDMAEESADTIRLLIPNQKKLLITEEEAFPVAIAESPNEVTVNQKDQKDEGPKPAVTKLKPACAAIAGENDFKKLRKNMAAKITDEAMITEAKKHFRSKCFTTDQIKNLSTLFLTSASKYQFFDAAYPHVSNQEEFASLQAEIKDEYFLKRFKALVEEQ